MVPISSKGRSGLVSVNTSTCRADALGSACRKVVACVLGAQAVSEAARAQSRDVRVMQSSVVIVVAVCDGFHEAALARLRGVSMGRKVVTNGYRRRGGPVGRPLALSHARRPPAAFSSRPVSHPAGMGDRPGMLAAVRPGLRRAPAAAARGPRDSTDRA